MPCFPKYFLTTTRAYNEEHKQTQATEQSELRASHNPKNADWLEFLNRASQARFQPGTPLP